MGKKYVYGSMRLLRNGSSENFLPQDQVTIFAMTRAN